MTPTLADYLENEAQYAMDNLHKAEEDIRESMSSFLAMVAGYNIDLSNFDEIIGNFDRLIRELNEAKQSWKLFEVKRTTVHLEMMNESLETTIKHFPTRQKRLIQEAAEAHAASDSS